MSGAQSHLAFVASLLFGSACGGQVVAPPSGDGDGAAPGSGATANGGTGGRANGGSANAGSGNPGGQNGSCNPSFCPSTPTAGGCCFGPNGPCGLDHGNGCTQGCQSDSDCSLGPTPCVRCPDGACALFMVHCTAGECIVTGGDCGACDLSACPQPPAGKSCCIGTSCGVDRTGLGMCERP